MKEAGFTLIEIMVGVVVLLLLSGLLMAGYNRFNDTQSVQQAARTVIANLQAVRTSAGYGTKPAGCDTLIGYRVTFTASGYQTSAFCQVGAVQQSVGTVTTYTLPDGVTFSSPPPQPITFYALDRGASADQTITINGNNTTSKVTVLASGVVSDFFPTPAP